MKVGIVGRKNIGTVLKTRLQKLGHEVCFAIGKDGANDFFGLIEEHEPVAVFIAISGDGKAASNYIQICLAYDIVPITCEKGSLSNFSHELKPFLPQIGYSAAAGGGTHLLQDLKGRYLQYEEDAQVFAVINGTVNFMSHGVSLGTHRDDMRELAIGRGMAESGAETTLEVVNSEFGDIKKKLCVVYNTALSQNEIIYPSMMDDMKLNEEAVSFLFKAKSNFRFVVAFQKGDMPKLSPTGTSFFRLETKEGWCITGTFINLNNTEGFDWLPEAENNAIHVIKGKSGSGGNYTLIGEGAGPGPTTAAMIDDFHRLTA